MLTRSQPTNGSGDGPPRRADALEPHQLWYGVRQSYKLIAGIAGLVFTVVMAATLLSHMQFRSVGRLYLGELEAQGGAASSRAQAQLELSASNQGVVGSEMEIIQSRSLVARAILASGSNVAVTRLGSSEPRYGAWLLARRDPLLLDAAADELAAKDTILTDERAQEQLYTLRFSADGDYDVLRDERKLGHGKLGEVVKVQGADLHLLAGKTRAPHAGARYTLLVRPLLESIDSALKALSVTSPKPTPQSAPVNVVSLEYVSSSPRQAASFLQELISAYLAERQSWKVEDAAAAERFVAEQLGTVRSSLDDLQQKLASYRSANRVVVADSEAQAMIEQIGKYEEQRVAARLEAAALSDVRRTLKGANPPVGAFLMGEANDSVLEGMATSLSQARQKLADLDTRFNEAAPEIRDQRAQVDAQLDAIRNYVSSRAARAQENLGTLDGIIGQYEKRLRTVPGAELGLAQLSREADVYSKTYSYLLERQQQTAIIKASTLSKNRVLDAPQLPHREDSPKLLLRLASGPLGLLLGVVVVLARGLLAGVLQSEADARGVLGSAPVLATVPRRVRRRAERGISGPGSLDVVGQELTSAFSEAFRTLRAQLYRLRLGQGQAILLTSPGAGDGKTTCALSLAALLAADGKRVLLIDADLRKANQELLLSAADAGLPGLRGVLRGEEEWANALVTVQCGAGQFYLLPAGGSGPVELLSGKRMGELLDDTRKRCDYVLLDAPSFPEFSDGLVLAGMVDSVLSVVRLGRSQRKATWEHARALSGLAALHVALLNDVGESLPTQPKEPRQSTLASRSSVAGRRPLRSRVLAWCVTGLMLLAAAAAASRFSPGAAQAISAAFSLHSAG
jgi:tyrosine-protein kinase Etk/Wzc